MLGKVAPLPLVAQRVSNHGLVPAFRQHGLKIGADEAGAARYQDHGSAIYGNADSGESCLMQQEH